MAIFMEQRLTLAAFSASCTDALVSTSSGTEAADVSGQPVFVPRPDWSQSAAIEPCTPPVDVSSSVTVFNLGTQLVAAFRRDLPRLLDPVGTPSEVRASFLASFGLQVQAALLRQGLATDEVRVCNVAVNAPGSRSTGRDFETNKKVGLHIDNHDRLPLRKRDAAIQLLAMNCGSQGRYFQFIDLSVTELAERVGLSLDDPQEDVRLASNSLKDRFLQSFPDYPVTSVWLPPGYAYIATPQNLIHDGAGGSRSAADVAFLMLGRYRDVRAAA